MTRRRARRVLEQAAAHVGAEVVVIAPDYLATSLSVADTRALEANITLVNEGLKKLRRWHRAAAAREKVACPA